MTVRVRTYGSNAVAKPLDGLVPPSTKACIPKCARRNATIRAGVRVFLVLEPSSRGLDAVLRAQLALATDVNSKVRA
jgi:hypothetical protein